MALLGFEQINSSLESSESDKPMIGITTHADRGLKRMIREIGQWEATSMSMREIGNLQIFLSREPGHSTHSIYRLAKSAKVKDIAKLVTEPSRNDVDQSMSWLSTIDRRLASRVQNNELEPLIVCLPGLLEAGNLLDGNHRAIAAFAYSSDLDERVPVMLGDIPMWQWMLLFAKGFLRSKLPISQRIEIASERLRSISINSNIGH